MKQEPFSPAKRIRSFKYAFQGISALMREEHNFRIHLVLLAAVVIAGFSFRISAGEWCLCLLCFGMVLMAEAMNSAIEALSDLVMPDPHPLIKKAKDVAAAGVLLTAIAAAAVGLIIFLPYIWNRI